MEISCFLIHHIDFNFLLLLLQGTGQLLETVGGEKKALMLMLKIVFPKTHQEQYVKIPAVHPKGIY